MLKTRYYLLFGLLCYLLFMLATAPAASLRLLLGDNDRVNVEGLRGSLWQGHADRVIIDDAYPIDDLNWRLHPGALLLLKLSASLQGQFDARPFAAELSVSATGNVQAKSVRAEIAAATLAELAAIPLAQLDGDIDIELASLVWQRGGIPRANGQIHWRQARITVAESVELGDVDIRLEAQDDGVLAKINNREGDLKTSGSARLGDDRQYQLNLILKPLAGAPANLQNSLAMFARRQRNGQFVVQSSGALPDDLLPDF